MTILNLRLKVCLALFAAALSFPSLARALLTEEEVDGLSAVIEVYNAAKNSGDLLVSLEDRLDLPTNEFLKTKMKPTDLLPKLERRTDSKLAFRFGKQKTLIEFVSIRTDLLLVNGRELEFLPGESLEVRWNRIHHLIEKQQVSRLDLFESAARAANDGGLNDQRAGIVGVNMNTLSSVVLAMQQASKNESSCGFQWRGANSACMRQKEVLTDGQTTADAMKSSTAAAEKCSSSEEAPLSEEDYRAKSKPFEASVPKQKGYLGKDFPDKETFDKSTDPYKGENVRELSKANGLNMTIKYKLSQIQSYYAKIPSDKPEYREGMKACLKPFLALIKSRTSSRGLRCYADKVAKSLDAGATAPAASAPSSAPTTGAKPVR